MLVSLVEVFLFAFVFPSEATFFPHVGKTAFGWLAGVGCFVQLEKFHIFDHALLEAEKFSFGVRLQRRGQVEQPAQVVKMGLVDGGFLRTNLRPFCFEFSRGHGSVANSESFFRLGMAGSVRGKFVGVNSGARGSGE